MTRRDAAAPTAPLPDPLAELFDLSVDDPAEWRRRIALLRREYAPAATIQPAYVNDLRFGGRENVNVLESRLEDPRACFLEEWDHKVRHRKFFEFLKCDPPFDHDAIAAMRKLEADAEVRLPPSLFEFMARAHVHEMIFTVQPTNNHLLSPDEWEVQLARDGTRYVRFIDENQGCCFWYVAWSPDEVTLDPPVFVGDYIDPEDEAAELAFRESVQITANHLSEFLYDYATEGAKWWIARGEADTLDFSHYDRNAPPGAVARGRRRRGG